MTIQVDKTITLELINDQHAAAVYALADDARLHLREWLPWVDKMQDIEFIRNFISDSKKRCLEGSDLAYVIISEGQVAGRVGLYNIDLQHRIASIGYWLGNAFLGKGMVTKSCKALIDYGFNTLQLNRIEIKCGTGNYKSQAIPEKLHFVKEGIIRQGEFVHDQFIDLYLYSMLKSEWKTQ